MRNYERLSIYEFGTHLLETGDLDPVYILLDKAEMNHDQLCRWLLAYWCLYNVGAASYISEHNGEQFYELLMTAAQNVDPAPTGGRWPRGHERRHFRGKAAEKAVHSLRSLGDPTLLVESFYEGAEEHNFIPFELVSQRVQKLVLFGPWISFKVADMLERVMQVPVDFNEAEVFMFKDPAKAAMRLWRERNPELAEQVDLGRAKVVQGMVNHVVSEHLINHFTEFTAPPRHDRAVNLQEIETILCKWKSHMNGHYPLWNDTREIRDGLAQWCPHSDTAKQLHYVADQMMTRAGDKE